MLAGPQLSEGALQADPRLFTHGVPGGHLASEAR